jgi:hypothetical protein
VPLTQQSWQDQVMAEVGLPPAGAPAQDAMTQQLVDAIAAIMPGIYDLAGVWAARFPAAYRPTVAFLVAKKRALNVILAQLRAKTDVSLGRLKLSLAERFKQTLQLAQENDKELAELVTRAAAARNSAAPVLAQLLATAPVEVNPYVPPAGPGQPVRPAALLPDPNAPWTRGDPLCPDPYSGDPYFPGGY